MRTWILLCDPARRYRQQTIAISAPRVVRVCAYQVVLRDREAVAFGSFPAHLGDGPKCRSCREQTFISQYRNDRDSPEAGYSQSCLFARLGQSLNLSDGPKLNCTHNAGCARSKCADQLVEELRDVAS